MIGLEVYSRFGGADSSMGFAQSGDYNPISYNGGINSEYRRDI